MVLVYSLELGIPTDTKCRFDMSSGETGEGHGKAVCKFKDYTLHIPTEFLYELIGETDKPVDEEEKIRRKNFETIGILYSGSNGKNIKVEGIEILDNSMYTHRDKKSYMFNSKSYHQLLKSLPGLKIPIHTHPRTSQIKPTIFDVSLFRKERRYKLTSVFEVIFNPQEQSVAIFDQYQYSTHFLTSPEKDQENVNHHLYKAQGFE